MAVCRRDNKWYGYSPDLGDVRDHYAVDRKKVFRLKSGALPSSVDLRPLMPPVYDQGQLGSCTGNAIAGAIEYDRAKQKLTKLMPSRLFIYYNERVIEGTISEDAGAQIRDGIKSVNQVGACSEISWPYQINQFAVKPKPSCYTSAKRHQAVSYARVDQTTDAVKRILASGFPIVFGFTVYDYFESDQMAKNGVLKMPAKGEGVVGGHAVLAVGYTPTHVLVRNSWAADWGINGYFLMPFEYLLNPDLSDDLWVATLVK